MSTAVSISLIIPARNEEAVIEDCLRSFIDSFAALACEARLEVIVALNGCTDGTQRRAESLRPLARTSGIVLKIVETSAGKAAALNEADRLAEGRMRVYADADIVCEPMLIEQLWEVLNTCEPRYASGTIEPTPGACWFSKSYAQIWSELPFVRSGVCGCGLYAVNQAGRKRWKTFPCIHSDDKFVRLHFTPNERFGVPARYKWPVPNGLWNLVKVRSRWCRGNAELGRYYGNLVFNDESRSLSAVWLFRAFLKNPLRFTSFVGIYCNAHFRAIWHSDSRRSDWERGR